MLGSTRLGILLLLAPFALVLACSHAESPTEQTSGGLQGSNGSTGSLGTGSAGGSGACNSGHTDACDVCVDQQCCSELSACKADQGCSALVSCYDACKSESCSNACDQQYPDAQDLVDAVDTCAEKSCASQCGGSGAGGAGSCGDSSSCGQCQEQSCCSEYTACAGSQDCSGLMDCLTACQNQACANGCQSQYPNGVDAAMAYDTCMENNCKSQCK